MCGIHTEIPPQMRLYLVEANILLVHIYIFNIVNDSDTVETGYV